MSPKLLGVICCMCAGITLSAQTINPENVTIARDKWGTPHIFAATDAEVAYGMAWANAEDAFDEIQEALYTANGFMGRLKGARGARTDYYVIAIGAKDTVEKYMPTFSAEYRQYMEGYCQGINEYARLHADKVKLKHVFPITVTQLVQCYVVSNTFLAGMPDVVTLAVNGHPEKKKSPDKGSNAWAMNGPMTDNNSSRICGNPHFYLNGTFSFYEAHLCSEQGLNVMGAFFHGSNTIALGATPNLAWTHTYNHFKGSDLYELQMHPTRKHEYRFGDEWLKLNVRKVTLRVKIAGIVTGIKKKFYDSVHGPVFKSKDGKWYAVRCLSAGRALTGQQYYEMTKAQDWKAFHKALTRMQSALFNLVYTDKDENIFFVSNGVYPKRNPLYEGLDIIPGNEPDALYETCYPIDSLAQEFNPDCHYVYNTNHNPYQATCKVVDGKKVCLPPSYNLRPGNNNRSYRFQEMIEGKQGFSIEAFRALKFDNQYTPQSILMKEAEKFHNLDLSKHPELQPALDIYKRWNHIPDPESKDATVPVLALTFIFEKHNWSDDVLINGLTFTNEDMIEGLAFASTFLNKHYGRLDVPYKDVFQYEDRGTYHETMGAPDAMTATYYKEARQGKFKAVVGDSYIFVAEYNDGKLQKLETLLPYATVHGPATTYARQLDLYRKHELRPQLLSKADVIRTAASVYHPK